MTNQAHKIILGLYQLLGGLLGVYLSLEIIQSIEFFSALISILLIIGFGLNIYSIFCGVLILFRYEQGLKLSRLNQYLQVLSFSIGGYSFTYVAGIYLSGAIDWSNKFKIDAKLGFSTWQITLNQYDGVNILFINVIAIILIISINKHLKKINAAKLSEQLLNLGEPT